MTPLTQEAMILYQSPLLREGKRKKLYLLLSQKVKPSPEEDPKAEGSGKRRSSSIEGENNLKRKKD